MDNIIKIWRTADAVTFDVDSTVITEEGIDELAKFCGKGKQITELYIYFVLFYLECTIKLCFVHHTVK